MTSQKDKEYIKRVLEGNTNAFSYFVDTYQDLAFTVAIRILKNREEAEDVVQDAFIKCYHSLRSFKGDSKFSTWLYRIVYHSALDKCRKNDRNVATIVIEEASYKQLDEVDNALDMLESKERIKVIKDALGKLDTEEQTIITLYYFDDLSIKEIAAIVDISADNVKIKLFRARKKLFKILKNKSELNINL
ncbi:RNA polymerase sigma factor [Joostella atrarenae]|uniref:RNA polymerase sigma factor n=1 Tax=Joostella atrarenae TaxID=679257 RepID=A0ABS9J3Q0_9FLAO|nr:RNA polymerase sigma factor [Joostella atrarenae]MCF8715057.1 RNA polymerase sigma factor [Joostella atrarenae]